MITVRAEMLQARPGPQKVFGRIHDELLWICRAAYGVHQPQQASAADTDRRLFSIEPTCGLVGSHGVIGLLDDPSSFDQPQRTSAQLLYFRAGFMEDWFPKR